MAATRLNDDNFVRRALADDGKTTASVAASPATAADASVKPAKADGKTDKTVDGVKTDAQKKEDLKKQLDSYKADRDGWNKSAKRYEDLLANEPDEFRRQMYQDALNNDRQNVSVYQKKIDEAAAKTGTDSAKTDQAGSRGNEP